jgi:hypothetical protein
LRNEKGFTFIEMLLITPFVLFFLAAVLTVGGYFKARDVVSYSAREAARKAASPPVTVGQGSQGWQAAVNSITGTLPADISVPGVSGGSNPHKAFDPVNPNPMAPDVDVSRYGDFVVAKVTYHLITPVPGMAKLLNPSASIMTPYIEITDSASYKAEQ